jgi:hypothetical protein
MDENKTSAAEAGLNSGKWIGQLVAAVVLAEGIWGLLASVTNNLLVPLLARMMEADPHSPLYLGKGELNFPAVFRSVLAFCFAGIVFVLLRQWSRRRPAQVRVKTVQVTKKVAQQTVGPLSITAAPFTASPVSATPPPVVTTMPTSMAPPAQPAPAEPKPTSQISQPAVTAPPMPAPVQTKPAPPAAPPAKPAKPKPPKEVYYNIVGEPINPTEDD